MTSANIECCLCLNSDRKALICDQCLYKGLRAHHALVGRYSTSLGTLKNKATTYLAGPKGDCLRLQRAEEHQRQEHLKRLYQSTSAARAQSTAAKEQLQKRREALSNRQANLFAARARLDGTPSNNDSPFLSAPQSPSDTIKLSPWPSPHLHDWRTQVTTLGTALSELDERIQHTRQVLLNETLSVYAIQAVETDEIQVGEVPGKEALLYRIGGAILPSIADIKRFPPDEISAAVSHTAHLVRLIAIYLGLRLPFLINAGPKLSIRAASLTVWAHKWSTRSPLYISSSITSASNNSSLTQFTTSKQTDRLLLPFIAGLSMLSYDIAYICSALGSPMRTTDEALHALLRASSQDTFQSKSHCTSIDQSLNLSYAGSLDFEELHNNNVAALASTASKVDSADEDEWALVEAATK